MGTVKILVESVQNIHIFLLNSKIKNLAVTLDPVRMTGFGDHRDTFLYCPAKSDLCMSSALLGTQYTHDIVIQISSSCKGSICLNLNASALAVINQLFGIA